MNIDKITNASASSSSSKGRETLHFDCSLSTLACSDACPRPFSYIKNTNDRAQIQRRLTPQDRSIPLEAVALDVTRIPSPDIDTKLSTDTSSTNIYESVLPTANIHCTSDVSIPIYESEWKHSLGHLILSARAANAKDSVAVIELPSPPPDLVSPTPASMNYFQQQNPYDKFLANRTATSDSMRRANMLRRLKDDAAFLYWVDYFRFSDPSSCGFFFPCCHRPEWKGLLMKWNQTNEYWMNVDLSFDFDWLHRMRRWRLSNPISRDRISQWKQNIAVSCFLISDA